MFSLRVNSRVFVSRIIKPRQSHSVVQSSPAADSENLMLTWKCHAQLMKSDKRARVAEIWVWAEKVIPYCTELDQCLRGQNLPSHSSSSSSSSTSSSSLLRAHSVLPLHLPSLNLTSHAHTLAQVIPDSCSTQEELCRSPSLPPQPGGTAPCPLRSPRLGIVSQSAYKPPGTSGRLGFFQENKQVKIYKRTQLYCSFSSETGCLYL